MVFFIPSFLQLLLLIFAACIHAKKVSIIGANGKTGRILVDLAAGKGFEVIAYTREGQLRTPLSPSLTNKVKVKSADVTRPETIADLAGDAVFFCASASKEGGPPSAVDNAGLVNTAKACIQNNIPRLVVVSSGAVSKPFSPVFLFLNLFGGIMTQKAEGEKTIRELYAKAPEKLGYTLVRPGGLSLELPVGPENLEINQNDEKSGRISRYDVASVCLESLNAPSASRTTFECYNKDTGKPLSSVFLFNLFNAKGESTGKGKYERQGSTWKELFTGLVKDTDLK